MFYKLRFVETELVFPPLFGMLMSALAEAELNRWMITHKLECQRIWTELQHVKVEFAFQLGSWTIGVSRELR